MSVHDKAKVSTTLSEFSNPVLSSQHVTTGNFMELNVAKSLELVPNQSIDITHRLFTRLEPMPVPTFGNARIHNKAFFVPFRTVMPAWNEFITDSVYVDSLDSSYIPQNVHLISNSTLVQMFNPAISGGSIYSRPLSSGETPDIVILGLDGQSVQPLILQPRGKQVLKLLMSLGYKIDFNLKNVEFYHSALPLLCLLRVYHDWYYPSAYSQDENAIRARFLLDYDDSEVPFDEFITPLLLRDLLDDIVNVCYSSSFLTSAWDNPVAPTDGSFTQVNVGDITTDDTPDRNYVSVDKDGTPVISNGNLSFIALSQYMIDSLKSLTDYMKRNQLAGARVVDRYLARYGVSLSSAKLNRSQLVGDFSQEIKFGDVTSTSDTDGANLGSFAGKGVSYGAGNYTFSTDEYGMFLILSSIVPEVSFYQGQDRITMHKTRYDFYTAEFDNQGVQALSTREVFVPLDAREEYPDGTTTYSPLNYNDMVFGFVPRYAEYKRGFDLITGDYILNSLNTGKDAWTLFRDVKPYFRDGVLATKHDLGFVQGNDATQFNRIFYVTDNSVDHFNIIHDFNIQSHFPGKSLYDVYEFENEDKAKKVVMSPNGTQAN